MSDFKLKLYHFEKEGKGVEPGEKKPAPIQLFVLYFRNFWKLTLYNLSLFASLIPFAALLCAVFIICVMGETGVENLTASEQFQSWNQTNPWLMIFPNIYHFFTGSSLLMSLGIILLCISFITFGPLSAGLFYAVRNITREEHVFTSDLFSQAWSNKKQAIPMGILDFFLTVAVLLYFGIDYSSMNIGNSKVIYIARYLALILYTFYLVARAYVYTVIVTFDMPFTQCFKNGLTLAYAHLGRALIIVGIIVAVIAVNLWLPLPSILLFPLFDISFLFFAAGFIAYKPIDRYMIQPAIKAQYQNGNTAEE